MRDIAPDTILDQRYQIVSRIGSGGMADVYLAHDLQLGRPVALKLLYRRFAEDANFVERFRREASAAAGLSHPNVVGVFDRGEWDGTYYIAMEYLEGRTLKQVSSGEGPLPPVRAIDYIVQILKAARFAHQRGVIHRDIKPHNVIVDSEDNLKVTDFGIARQGPSEMTETGSIMGTAQYLSPEQAQGQPVTAASDLYSAGIVLYELLAGRVPFDGDSPVTIALKQVSELPVPPSVYNGSVPPELDAVVLRALEKDPARRYGEAGEFIAALEAVRTALTAPAGERTAAFAAIPPVYPAGAEGGTTIAAGGAGGGVDGYGAPDRPLGENGEPDHGGESDERGQRRRAWLIPLLILLALGGGALAYTLTRPAQKTVPDVVGAQLQAAVARLQNDGFEVNVTRVTSSEPRDKVLRTSPQPNMKADEGSIVELTVSDGPGQASVPDVAGLNVKAATKALRQAGFKVARKDLTSDTVAAGDAIGTSPPAGVQVDVGTRITLLVSTGKPQVTVPDVTGQTEAAATSQLTSAGFKTSLSERESATKTAGTVISQSPGGGSTAAQGSVVALVIAKAPTQVPVPNVVGRDSATAQTLLSDAGFTVVVQSQDVTTAADDGQVINQHPTGGKAKRGSRVTIVVGHLVTTPTTPTTPTTTPTTP
jgi:serine/threonine-protein kinase